MREIIFRGKRTDNGKFIEGDLIKLDNNTLIATKDMWASNLHDNYSTTKTLELEVLPVVAKSVGQFTGLTDKNGTKVFEGDIISYYDGKKGQEIRYSKDGRLVWKLLQGETTINLIEIYDPLQMEVIGNIHDKPRIIKVS